MASAMLKLNNHSRYDVYFLWCEGLRLAHTLTTSQGKVLSELDSFQRWARSVHLLLEDNLTGGDRERIVRVLMPMSTGSTSEASIIKADSVFSIALGLKNIIGAHRENAYTFAPTRTTRPDYLSFLIAAKRIDAKINTLGTAVSLNDVAKKSQLSLDVCRRCLAKLVDEELGYYVLDAVDEFLIHSHEGIDDAIEDLQKLRDQDDPAIQNLAPSFRPKEVALPTSKNDSADTVNIFISYSRNDRKYLDDLKLHLKPLVRDGNIDVWDDSRIHAGDLWRDEIRIALEKATIGILLISKNFLASDFIVSDELPLLLEAAKKRGTTIIQVVLSPCYIPESLQKFQMINSPNEAITTKGHANRERIYMNVVKELHHILQRKPRKDG